MLEMRVLEWACRRYKWLLRRGMEAAVGIIVVYLASPVDSSWERLGLIATACGMAVWMFWGIYALVGYHVGRSNRRLAMVVTVFVLAYFLVSIAVGLRWAISGAGDWPIPLLVSPAMVLGAVRAYAKIGRVGETTVPSESNYGVQPSSRRRPSMLPGTGRTPGRG